MQAAETSTTKTGILGNGAASRLPLHPKLRKILVESNQGITQVKGSPLGRPGGVGGARGGGGGANGTGSFTSSSCRSRNSNAAPSLGEKTSTRGGGALLQAAVARKKPATRTRARNVLSAALSVGASSTHCQSSNRRARTPSPVLTESARLDNANNLESPRRASIPKSASVPANLTNKDKASGSSTASSGSPVAHRGILKRSSSFLAGFEARSFCSSLLRRRPGRTGSSNFHKTGATVAGSPRKCVSFSLDTGFTEEKSRPPADKSKVEPVHEARIYRKGVLEGRRGCEEPRARPSTNLPLTWEESLGGPKALLGAVQDGNDEIVKRIIALVGKSGLGNIDVNAVDSSGRTAISHMAGNGSALMLEACLTFPGTDVNLPDNEGNTPLHFAAQAGQTECLNILLQKCPTIEVDVRNSFGFTPLMKAALQGRTKCAKLLLFAGANPTLRDYGRGLRAEQWARFCGRYSSAEAIERFSGHRLLDKTTSCRWGSEPELAAQVLQGKLMPIPSTQVEPSPSGLKSKIRRVFRTSSSHTDKNFSLVSQLTSAALCASSPVLPKSRDVSPAVKSLLQPLSVPQLRVTLATPQDIVEKPITNESKTNHGTTYMEKIEKVIVKPPRMKKKNK